MNIYVANLHYRLNDEDLHQIFSEFGEVTSAKIIKDHETGRSRGFGFVEMANQEEGSKAMDSLNGTEIEGKQLMVNEARPKQPNNNSRGGGFGGGNRGGGGGYGGGGGRGRY
jgi:RNA recognition motif-containing protein